MKPIIILTLLLCFKPLISQQGASAQENPYGLSEKDVAWMREATIRQLEGCRVKGAADTWIHTPDGIGNYKALWTRDYYYMVEYAGDLMDPEEIQASIDYLLKGQREDGCIPDRVNISGKAVYSPGPDHAPMADHAMDNGPFMALLVCSYVRQFKDEALFRNVEGKLLLGLDFIHRNDSGLVYNDPENPQCVYGFTDIVKKTGNLLFSSLLYYQACREMEALCRKYDVGNSEVYKTRAAKIQKNIDILWDQKSGMFWAADQDCRQIDIWGSAYAVSVGITSTEQGKRISAYLSRHAEDIILNGQVRHLSAGDAGWNTLFIPCAEGTYQNGAFWATPLAWVVPVIAQADLPLAKKVLQDAIDDFQKNGINECINVDYINIPNYVASATNVYCLTQGTAAQSEPWAGARWIAFERLEEDMRIVPGVHGFGDQLGEKGIKRSVVPMFRKDFIVNDDVESATMNISGLGHYELFINGEKIGDSFLSPGWSSYQKRIFYNSFDITEHLAEGGNAIGVFVGNGFYNVNRERYRKLVIAYGYPRLIFNIRIRYKSGAVEYIVSDEDCRVSPSPITFSSIYGGEDYDARLEQEGWDTFGYEDSKWQKPKLLDDSIEKLVPEKDYPVLVMDEFDPVSITKSKTGRTIYDFGQNASGIISLKVKGNRGAQIRIRPDELLNAEGDITQRSGGGPYEFNYTLKGEGIEAWQPSFSYYGFRYADVEIIEAEHPSAKTEIVELKMLHTRNSSPVVGTFSCSDTLFNQIFDLINWSMKSNMASVATDCPHREKLGWLEQTYLIGPSMHYNYDIEILYNKIVDDMMDSQLDNGLVPDIAPEYVPFEGGFRDSPEWGSASIIIPWHLYRWYGDMEVLARAYSMMTSYVDYLQSKSKDHMLYHGLGDWYDLGPEHPGVAQLTPQALTATSVYFYDLKLVSKVAALLNKPADAIKYGERSELVREAFQQTFYDPETAVVGSGSQTSYAMSLYTGILPEQDNKRVFENLVDSIEQNDYALTAGDIGYHFLVRVLSEKGRSDLLYKMNNRSDKPGYGLQIKKGATSLTESWAALPNVSNLHMMLGHLMEWFYSGLGGIYQADNSTGYRDVIIAPKPVGEIKWTTCSYHSKRGLIVSEWKLDEKGFSLEIEVPETSSAEVILPTDYQDSSIEVVNLSDERLLDIEITEGTFRVASGRYKITASL